MARAGSAPMKSYIRAPWSALVRVKSHKGIPCVWMCACVCVREADSHCVATIRVRSCVRRVGGWFFKAHNNEKSAPRCLGLGNGAIHRKPDETLLSVKRTPKYVNRSDWTIQEEDGRVYALRSAPARPEKENKRLGERAERERQLKSSDGVFHFCATTIYVLCFAIVDRSSLFRWFALGFNNSFTSNQLESLLKKCKIIVPLLNTINVESRVKYRGLLGETTFTRRHSLPRF